MTDDFHVMGAGDGGLPIEHTAEGMAKAERPGARRYCGHCGGVGNDEECSTTNAGYAQAKAAGKPIACLRLAHASS